MNKSISKKTLTFVISLMLLLQSFIVFPSSAIENDQNTLIELDKSASKKTLTVGDEFTIDYTIRPNSITPENNEYKEIALVIDTSFKMNETFHGEYTRLEKAKEAAIDFINGLTLDRNNNFIGNNRVKVSLISFRNRAFFEKYSENKSFVDLSNKQDIEKLKKKIANLKTTGNEEKYGDDKKPGKSNIGDGLREAYFALKNNGDPNSQKSLVLLTHGEASAYSYKKIGNKWYYYLSDKNGYKTGDNPDYSIEYAKKIARLKLTDESMKLKTTIVDLGNGTNKDFLKSIVDIVDGEYVKATDENCLDGIYNSISSMQNNLKIKDMLFEETFPKDLVIEEVNIVEGTADVNWGGQNIRLGLGDREYTLNNQGKLVAEATKFTVKLKATNIGDYKLEDKLTYYLDGDSIITSMPEINLKVVEATCNVEAPIYVYNSTDKNKYTVGEEILINYLIKPENIPVECIVSDDQLADQIQRNLSINGISYYEVFPNEIEIIDVSENLSKIGEHTVNSKNVGNILYKLNESKTEYIADPIKFWVKVKANKAGNYKLAVDDDDNNIAYLKYRDINGLETTKTFDQLELNIYEEIPPDIVAILTQGQSFGDDYILKIKIDEPTRLKVMNFKDGVLNNIIEKDYTHEDLEDYPKEFTWNISSDELQEENLFDRFSLNIEAEDIYGNITTETIGFSDISFTMNDFDHAKSGLVDQRLVTLNISSESGAWIKEIIVNGELVIKDRPTNEGAYSKHNVLVNDGINNFSVKIINRDQNETIQHFEEQIDAQPPQINAEYTEENSMIKVVFPDEEATVTWVEVDINGDGEITDGRLDENSNPTDDEVFDLSEIELFTIEQDKEYKITMKPEWDNKKIIVKGKDTSGNIGSAELSDLPPIEIVKQGIFIENDYNNIEEYLVTNGEKQIIAVNKFETYIGTLLRVIDKANISNPEATIQLNITNEQAIHSKISELKLYKLVENKIEKDHIASINYKKTGNKLKFSLPISGVDISDYYILVYKYECNASSNPTYQSSKVDGNKLILTNKLDLLNTSDILKILIEHAPNLL